MNNVVRLRLRHARTSAGSRAAKRASNSAVTPATIARSSVTSSDQYSGGIKSLCHHLETCVAETFGISAASAMREPMEVPQSSIIARNDPKSAMPAFLGPTVLKSKALASLDWGLSVGHTVRMADSETDREYKQRFTKRIADARISRGWKQWEAAQALDIPQDKYKQYEGRSLMPHRLIVRFALICRVDPVWLLTGYGKKPLKVLAVVEEQPERIAKPKRHRAKRAAERAA